MIAILLRENVRSPHVHWRVPNGLYRMVPAYEGRHGTAKFILAVPEGCTALDGSRSCVAMRIVDEEGSPFGYANTLIKDKYTIREAFASLGYETEGDLTQS